MSLARWLLGVALLVLVLAPLGLAAREALRRWAPALDRPSAVLAGVVLTLSGLVVLLQVLGVLGLLRPVPVVAGALLVGVSAVVGVGRGREDGVSRVSARPEPDGAPRRWVPPALATMALAGVLLVAGPWVRRTLVALDVGVGGVDSLWYHLPFAATFAQRGSLVDPVYVDVEFVTAFYPANVELLHATGILLMDADVLTPVLNLAAFALALLAGWCLGRPWAVSPVTMLATAAVLGLPSLSQTQPGSAKNDVWGIALVLACAAFVVARPSSGRTTSPQASDRLVGVVAALAAGLAIGTKLSFLATGGSLLVLLALRDRGRLRRALEPFGAAALTGGFFYLRNAWTVGNPLPWVQAGPLPAPEAPRSAETARALAGYLLDRNAWAEHFLPALDRVVGPAWVPLVLLSVVGVAAALVRPPSPPVRGLAVVAAVSAVAYVVTPSTAAGPEGEPVGFVLNVRYALPAVVLGVCLLAVVLHRWSRATAVVLVAVIAVTQLGSDGQWSGPFLRTVLALAGVCVVLAAAVFLAPGRARLPRPVVGTAAVLALTGVAVVGFEHSRTLVETEHTRPWPPHTVWSSFDMGPVYDWARERSGARIGVTGTTGAFFQAPLHGPRFDNRVRVLGVHEAGGTFRPAASCEELLLAAGDATHVVTTPYLDIWDPFRPLGAPEEDWLEEVGASVVLRSGLHTVFALPDRPRCRP